MAIQRTLCLIKPDAVKRNLVGPILAMIEKEGLQISALRMLHLSKKQAEGFYAVHAERPFFGSLTDFMSSGPIVAAVLTGENAIVRYRKIMGATNPEKAEEGTLRKAFALGLEENSVHGSDAVETASVEIAYFFNSLDIVIAQ